MLLIYGLFDTNIFQIVVMGLMQITELDLCEIMVTSDLNIYDRLMPLNESHTPKFLNFFLMNKIKCSVIIHVLI